MKNKLICNPHLWAIIVINLAIILLYYSHFLFVDLHNPKYYWLRWLVIIKFKNDIMGILLYIPFIYSANLSGDEAKIIDQSIYENNNINFDTLKHLASIGLITYEWVGYKQTYLNQQIDISYYNTTIRVEFKNPRNNELSCGNALLTNVGKELAKVCGSKPVDGFVDLIIKVFSQRGLVCHVIC